MNKLLQFLKEVESIGVIRTESEHSSGHIFVNYKLKQREYNIDESIYELPEFTDLLSKGLNFGNSWTKIDKYHLNEWILRNILENGSEKTYEYITKYATLNYNPGWQIVAITGFRIHGNYKLPTDINLVKIHSLPESKIKESYLKLLKYKNKSDIFMHNTINVPENFFMRKIQIKPKGETDEKKFPDWDIFFDFITCVSAVGKYSPLAVAYWVDLEEWIPGYGFGYSTAQPLNDVNSNIDKVITEHTLNKIYNIFYTKWKKRTQNEKNVLRIAISRINQAIRRTSLSDKAIDIGIALEAMVMEDLNENSPIKFNLRLRVAKLLGKNVNSRYRYYATINTLYDLRSKAAHGGSITPITKLGKKNNVEVEPILSQSIVIAKKIAKRIICYGFPDWKMITIGE